MGIIVDYYGAPTPLQSLAGVTCPDAQTVQIQPFDQGAIKDIERAIIDSDTGFTPNNDGKVLRIVAGADGGAAQRDGQDVRENGGGGEGCAAQRAARVHDAGEGVGGGRGRDPRHGGRGGEGRQGVRQEGRPAREGQGEGNHQLVRGRRVGGFFRYLDC